MRRSIYLVAEPRLVFDVDRTKGSLRKEFTITDTRWLIGRGRRRLYRAGGTAITVGTTVTSAPIARRSPCSPGSRNGSEPLGRTPVRFRRT